ncbi:ethylene-dependent gravitropism-deficient andyellow-green-like 2 [Striga asiatica]|uniref:Ethylene-dependent gravitropism-deficient andyellow-green-like 2 n=1 Tax=Striga asiatica TaxID=4170 RepID=A0A5A7QXR0_STRAF|nr:ethylene-dependent gravitropism-deficient andyellow-green-like 2 [Striga asiatica]
MGCGESKQAVATENTLTKSKSKNSDKNDPPIEKPANNDNNVKNNNNANENVKENEEKYNKLSGDEIANLAEKKVEKKNENVVEKKGDEAFLEENVEKDEELVKGGEMEKVVVPNESPKKDDNVDHHEETIEPKVTEDISGRSTNEKG